MHRQLTILLTAVLVLAGTACTIADSGTRSSRSANATTSTTGYLPQQVRDRLYNQQIELRVDDVLTRIRVSVPMGLSRPAAKEHLEDTYHIRILELGNVVKVTAKEPLAFYDQFR